MGCSSSSPRLGPPRTPSPGPGPPRNIPQRRPPQGDQRSRPQPTKEHLVGVELPEHKGVRPSSLKDSLKCAADILSRQDQDITIIAAGGIRDIYGLKRSRPLHDLLFLGDHLEQSQKEALKSAMKTAQETFEAPVYDGLFNLQAVREMGYDFQKDLIALSLQSNVKIFGQGRLTVLAVPPAYALACKLDRLGTANERQYDLDDAVEYLKLCIIGLDKQSGVNWPVRLEWIDSTCARFKKSMPPKEQLMRVRQKHRQKYQREGLVM